MTMSESIFEFPGHRGSQQPMAVRLPAAGVHALGSPHRGAQGR